MIKAAALSMPLPKIRDIIEVLLASLAIAFFAQVSIPYGPVPHTLQTFAIALLGLLMSPKKAAAACLCYLGEASLGLPVLAGFVSNPLWFTGMTTGFLIGFPASAYIISSVERMWKRKTFITSFISVMAGQTVLYVLGVTWLAVFIGFEAAIMFGLMPFILTELVKTAAAAGIYNGICRSKG